ncbi:hypothetical protein [Nitrobacter vulgaris]|uniref:hypothetical protein n=1 Tax=Nitrobacter vulgaris TaxID=29421 RepID=UPI00286CE02B|nr:hypothetical protein [Nitrobacter vulgaris]
MAKKKEKAAPAVEESGLHPNASSSADISLRIKREYLLIRSVILHFLVGLIAMHRRACGLLPIPWSHHPVVSRG